MNIKLKEFVEKEFKKYNWEYEYIINNHYEFCDVIFPYIIIDFFYNSQYRCVECYIYDVNDVLFENQYHLSSLLQMHKVDISDIYIDFNSVNNEEYIRQCVKLIYENLMYLIKGEFKSFENYNSLKKDSSYPKSIIKKIPDFAKSLSRGAKYK
jgi:hypothetical protein